MAAPQALWHLHKLFYCLLFLCTISVVCFGNASAASIAAMMEIPARASAGETITINDYVSNYGSAPYGPFTMTYYLSKSPSLAANAVPVGQRSVPRLASRTEDRAAVVLTIPATVAEGSYYIVRVEGSIDHGASDTTILISKPLISKPGGTPPLPVETPPPANSVLPVAPIPAEPEIIVPDSPPTPGVYFAPLQGPPEIYIGETFPLIDTIFNTDSDTAKLVDVTYSLVRDPQTARGKSVATWKVLSLKPGDTQYNDKMASGLGLVPGFYYLMREAKLLGSSGVKLLEPRVMSPVPIHARYNPRGAYPDLTQVRTEFPKHPSPGTPVDITDIITNIGNTCARDVAVAYYASPSPVFDPAGALLLGHTTIVSICPGEQITLVTTVTVPQITASGSYYLYSVIDPCAFIIDACYDSLPELRKDNNINGGAIKAGGYCFTGVCVF